MIIKSYELKKKINKTINYFLLYGENEGLKNEILENHILRLFTGNIYKFNENDVISNIEGFEESIYNKSFFEEDKIIIIYQATNLIAPLIKKIINEKITNIKIIIKAGILDKKSKLRNFFEESPSAVIIPFYEETNQSLSLYAQSFFNNNKVKISTESINFIVRRSKNRLNLKNELEKIVNYCQYKNSIHFKDLLKLTNLSENQNISELVDNCLSRDKNKILSNINENNFNTEDCIIILRTFLAKLKRLNKLHIKSNSKQLNIDNLISSFKPAIFWKDKDVVKKQLTNYDAKTVIKLIRETNEVELLIKKNNTVSSNFIMDFIQSNFA